MRADWESDLRRSPAGSTVGVVPGLGSSRQVTARSALATGFVGAVLFVAACDSGTSSVDVRSIDPTDSTQAPDITEPVDTIGSPETTDRGAPVVPTGSVRFAVIGDFGTDCCGEADVAALVDQWQPQFIVTTGDNRYDALSPDRAIGQYYADYIGNYDGEYGAGAEVNRFFPAPGNHDYSSRGGFDRYLDYFDLPGEGIETSGTSGNERYYDFVQGPVQFFVVNTNEEEPDGVAEDSAQADWLRTNLAASTAPWQIVVTHHPPLSSGHHGSIEEVQWPFVEWGADVVISGHEHSYERLMVGDVPLIVNGSGGQKLRPKGTQEHEESQIFYGEDYGALFVEGCAGQLTFEFDSVSDGTVDQFTVGDGVCPPQ